MGSRPWLRAAAAARLSDRQTCPTAIVPSPSRPHPTSTSASTLSLFLAHFAISCCTLPRSSILSAPSAGSCSPSYNGDCISGARLPC